MLIAIKLLHTLIWAFLAASILALPVAGVLRSRCPIILRFPLLRSGENLPQHYDALFEFAVAIEELLDCSEGSVV